MTSFSSKTQARREALRRLSLLTSAEKSSFSGSILDHLGFWQDLTEAGTIMLFAGMESEPDLLPLLDSHLATFCFPKVEGDALEVFAVGKCGELVRGAFGIREPKGDPAGRIAPEEIDLVLVPGLGFGLGGERLGRGGGYYDRFLPRLKKSAKVVGVCFECQIFATLPVELHDIRMHLVFSEAGKLEFEKTDRIPRL